MIAFTGSQGNFQLNVYKAVMLHNVLTLMELLTDSSRCFVIATPLRPSPIGSASASILVIV